MDGSPKRRGADGRVELTTQRVLSAGLVGEESCAALGQYLGDAPILLLDGGRRYIRGGIAGLALLAGDLLHDLFICNFDLNSILVFGGG